MPLRNEDHALLADYDRFFGADGVELIEVSRDVIDLAASLRAQFSFKTPDAIHLATALHAGANVFLTADAALQRCPGITIELVQP